MARKPNFMPLKTTRLASPTSSSSRQQGSQVQSRASQNNKTTPPQQRLASQTNASQGRTPLKTKTLANAKACKPTMHASQGQTIRKRNGSQVQIRPRKTWKSPLHRSKVKKERNMPRKAARLASPTSRIFTGRNPPTLHSQQNSTVILQRVPRVFSVILNKQGILDIPVCILPRPIPSPVTCASSSQYHTAFEIPSSFPVLLFPCFLAFARS